MRVFVSFFASHRDAVGQDEAGISLPDGAVVAHAADELCRRFPALHPLIKSSRPAVNEEYCNWERPLLDEDRLVFIPPVSGG